MGMFDTYYIAWGDASEGVQTKQLENSMASWRVGERAPLAELDQGDQEVELARESFERPFSGLVEDWTLGSAWGLPSVAERHFYLGHLNGVFSDYVGAFSREQAIEHSRELTALWCDDPLGRGLAAMSGAIAERNAMAWLSLALARAQIGTTFLSWRQEMLKKRRPSTSESKRESAMSFLKSLRAYQGPSLAGVSRSQVEAALERLTADWPERSLGFDGPLGPAPAQGVAEETALSIGVGRGWSARNSIGAPSPQDLLLSSQPQLSGPPTAKRALSLLRAGHWERFEQDAARLSADVNFLRQARAEVRKLCLSRVGAFWAAGLWARRPELMPETVGPEATPICDWLVARAGLPSRLVAPLLTLGAPASPELALHCLLPHHEALFDQAIERAGGAANVGLWEGDPFCVVAAGCSSLRALRALAREGLLRPEDPASRAAADCALRREEQTARSSLPTEDATPPASVQCAAFLLSLGIESSVPASERLLAHMARASRHAIDGATPMAPEERGKGAPRI